MPCPVHDRVPFSFQYLTLSVAEGVAIISKSPFQGLMSGDPRLGRRMKKKGWQLPAMRCTTLGMADTPTVSSWEPAPPRVAQSAELSGFALDVQAVPRRKGLAAEKG
jgi:hypothetical protein